MNKQQIIEKLTADHRLFTDYVSSLSEEDFLTAPNGKWSAGQQLDHIFRGVSPVKLALTLPKFVPKLIFGTANRSSRNYDQLVEKYQGKLAAGSKAGGRFLPAVISFDQRTRLTGNLTNAVAGLNKRVEKLSEDDLDKYILPHPILGKLTMREMLYFTIYHAGHHHRATETNLSRS